MLSLFNLSVEHINCNNVAVKRVFFIFATMLRLKNIIKSSASRLNLDLIGFTASMLCAIHCAALPFLLTLLPLTGLHFLTNPWVEYAIILLSLFIASYALVHGYRRHHHRKTALTVVFAGFVLIGAGHLLTHVWLEVVLTSLGASVIAIAHMINWKHMKQSRAAFPDCIHSHQ